MSHQASAPKRMWHDPTFRPFMLLWTGQGASALGTAVSTVALPLLAISVLHASAQQIGYVAAIGLAINPLLLLVGAIVDRLNRRSILLVSDSSRAVLTALIPIMAAFGILTMRWLYVIVLCLGVLTAVFQVSYQAYLPESLSDDLLPVAMTWRQNTESGASVAGPVLAGFLVRLIGPASTLLVDAFSFVASWVGLAFTPQLPYAKKKRPLKEIPREIWAGIQYVRNTKLIWRLLGFLAHSNFCLAGMATLAVLFLVRSVGVKPGGIGLLLAVEYVGAFVGGLLVMKLARAYRAGRVLVVAATVGPLVSLAIPFTTAGWGLSLFVVGMFVPAMTATMFVIIGGQYRQFQVKKDQIENPSWGNLMGRTTATIRTFSFGVMPFGALTAGLLGGAFGPRAGLLILAVTLAVSPLWVLVSPAWRMTNAEFGVR